VQAFARDAETYCSEWRFTQLLKLPCLRELAVKADDDLFSNLEPDKIAWFDVLTDAELDRVLSQGKSQLSTLLHKAPLTLRAVRLTGTPLGNAKKGEELETWETNVRGLQAKIDLKLAERGREGSGPEPGQKKSNGTNPPLYHNSRLRWVWHPTASLACFRSAAESMTRVDWAKAIVRLSIRALMLMSFVHSLVCLIAYSVRYFQK
jgi:hypothetical protein